MLVLERTAVQRAACGVCLLSTGLRARLAPAGARRSTPRPWIRCALRKIAASARRSLAVLKTRIAHKPSMVVALVARLALVACPAHTTPVRVTAIARTTRRANAEPVLRTQRRTSAFQRAIVASTRTAERTNIARRVSWAGVVFARALHFAARVPRAHQARACAETPAVTATFVIRRRTPVWTTATAARAAAATMTRSISAGLAPSVGRCRESPWAQHRGGAAAGISPAAVLNSSTRARYAAKAKVGWLFEWWVEATEGAAIPSSAQLAHALRDQ